jgi:hypothetical protein
MSTELPLFDGDKSTSRIAYDSVDRRRRDAEVLGVIRGRGAAGATIDEVCALSGLLVQTVSGAMKRLKVSARVVSTGERRRTRSGRPAEAWRAA